MFLVSSMVVRLLVCVSEVVHNLMSKVSEFLNFAFLIKKVVEVRTLGSKVVFHIKGPCSMCKIKVFKERHEVEFDLWSNGFVRGYTTWYAHDERKKPLEEQAPISYAKEYYDMLEADDEPLYERCQKYSTLEAATRLLNWKAECNVPEATYNRALSIFKDMLPDAAASPSGGDVVLPSSYIFFYVWLSIRRTLSPVTGPKLNGFPLGP
uniref:Transposase-associated domain-containing protein n=1 Tax=Tanacetum cinerariifolium TaxID=118510 RepID=A0A6L2MYR1_TANCI|nr:hypothetical protein [Tanacetum cinerariifolium]